VGARVWIVTATLPSGRKYYLRYGRGRRDMFRTTVKGAAYGFMTLPKAEGASIRFVAAFPVFLGRAEIEKF
jgi:hypothetical protein